MATLQLAQWVVDLRPEVLPESVRKAALRSLYNYIGCAIGGSNHTTVTKAYNALSPFFGASTSTIFGHNGKRRVDAQHAALLNGIASHVHDYDDTHLATIIHPTGPVASALLAYAELKENVSEEDLLAALVAGIEASCKLGLAVWPTHYDVGWHITSSTGSIGAAVAVSKLMKLDVEQTAHAIGIAATQVTGLREMFGSDTKSFHPGRAAQSGLLAAVLAEKGYTSSLQAIEAKRGWANVVVDSGTPQLERFLGSGDEGLGQSWEVERNAFKPFPCGIVCHPAIDGCIQLHAQIKESGLSVTDVEKAEARVHHLVIELTSKKTPKDGLEAKFSVFHGCAVGLLYGKAGPAEYADEVVKDPVVVSLRDRITAAADEGIRSDEVHLVLTFEGGKKVEKHVEHAVGSLEVPMTDGQLSEKFIDQCSLVLGSDKAKQASDAVWRMGDSADVTGVLATL